jgi:hypothetical protein
VGYYADATHYGVVSVGRTTDFEVEADSDGDRTHGYPDNPRYWNVRIPGTPGNFYLDLRYGSVGLQTRGRAIFWGGTILVGLYAEVVEPGVSRLKCVKDGIVGSNHPYLEMVYQGFSYVMNEGCWKDPE